MDASHFQVADQITTAPLLMAQWNTEEALTGINLLRPPATDPTAWGKTSYTLHYLSTCLPHSPRLVATHLEVDPSQKNSNWMQGVSQLPLFKLLCGATISDPRGVLTSDKPSMKQLLPTAEDHYKKSPSHPMCTGLSFTCLSHLTN